MSRLAATVLAHRIERAYPHLSVRVVPTSTDSYGVHVLSPYNVETTFTSARQWSALQEAAA